LGPLAHARATGWQRSFQAAAFEPGGGVRTGWAPFEFRPMVAPRVSKGI
jgi:hypothetical protein